MTAPAPTCPVDDSPLTPYAHGRVAFHGCRRCHGLWFTAAAMNRARKGPVLADPFADQSSPAAAWLAFRVRLCPGCGRAMQTRGVDGVEVDACPACRSVWLDAGELDTVLAWQRLRDRPVLEPVLAAALVTAPPHPPAHTADAGLPGVADLAELAVEIAGEVAVREPWAALELLGHLAGFLGEVVSGGGEVALELAGGVLSLVGGLLDGL